jgi:hypothetical protein
MPTEHMGEYLRGRLKVELLKLDRLKAVATFPPDLQGPPAAGHGGGTAALLLEMVRMVAGERDGVVVLPRPLRLEVTLHRELPLETPLQAEVEPGEGGWCSRIRTGERLIAEAVVRPGADPLPILPAGLRQRFEASLGTAYTVPGYEWCLGCGFRNPRGAQVRFEYNDDFMWKRLAPLPHFRCQDGSLFPGYACIVTDELGWWLGALRQGECGLSNRVLLTLGDPVPHAVPLLALGLRAAVRSGDSKGRIWQTQALLLTGDWQPVAAADVQFAGSRAFTKLMLPGFVVDDGGAAIRRAFPRDADRDPAAPRG